MLRSKKRKKRLTKQTVSAIQNPSECQQILQYKIDKEKLYWYNGKRPCRQYSYMEVLKYTKKGHGE